MNAAALTFTSLTLVISAPVLAQASWQRFSSGEAGFSVSLPATPVRRSQEIPATDSTLLMFQASLEGSMAEFSVSVGLPRERGMYDSSAMNAFLTNHLATMVDAVDGRLEESGPFTFKGHPAVAYRYYYQKGASRNVVRGFTFMIDGGHMRVSMTHAAAMKDADKIFERFRNSFELTPLRFQPAARAFTSPTGISMTPPEGWLPKPPRHAAELTRYEHLTRQITLMAANDANYDCGDYEAEFRTMQKLDSAEATVLGSRRLRKLVTMDTVPRYKVTLMTVHYCFDTASGVTVVTGTEEEGMFWRWAPVFEGAAATLRGN